MKKLITFGQDHIHKVSGVVFDSECVARLDCPGLTSAEARGKVFEVFGPKFCFEYDESEFKAEHMKYFPRGIVDVPT